MILPTKPQAARKPGTFPRGKTWLFFGPPKIGKTPLASQWPKPFVLDMEDGWDEFGGMIAHPQNLDDVAQAMEALEGSYGNAYETLVIDTLDVVHDWLEQETLEEVGRKIKRDLDAMGEAPEGLDWAISRKKTMGFLEACRVFARTTGKNVVLIAHSTAVMAEKGTTTQKAMTIDFPGKLARRIPAKVDAVGYCFGVKTKDSQGKPIIERRVSFEPYSDLEAGCRFTELSGKILPMSFKAIAEQFKTK